MTDAFRLIQSGQVVARSQGEHAAALREIISLSNMHSQDGPITLQRRYGKAWRMYGVDNGG